MNLLDLFEKEIQRARSNYAIWMLRLQMDVEMFL